MQTFGAHQMISVWKAYSSGVNFLDKHFFIGKILRNPIPDCRKRHFRALKLQNFMGEAPRPPPHMHIFDKKNEKKNLLETFFEKKN